MSKQSKPIGNWLTR